MILKLTLDHALYVSRRMRKTDRDEVMATRWNANDNDNDADFALSCFKSLGSSFVAINKKGVPVIIGGVAMNAPGIGTAWMVGTDDWPSVALEVSRFCRKSIKKYLKSEDIHRIHAYSSVFHSDSHKWLELVGMKRGPLLKKWGKNHEDFILFEVFK